MSAIPIITDQDSDDPELLRRQPMRGIPLPDSRSNPMEIPTGVIGSPRASLNSALAIGQPSRPQVMSSGGIPVTPQTPRGIIPTDPATGQVEQVNNKGIPIKAGIAGLWAKADNINNPVLRVLGKIGTGALKAIDVAGQAALPTVENKIPGSTGFEQKEADRRTAAADDAAKLGLESAQTEHLKAETAGAGQPKPKEETWEVTPHFTGPNGEPVEVEKNSGTMRVGGAEIPGIKGAEPKAPADKPAHISYDSGIPVSVTDKKGNVFDVNDPKLPAELKPLVDSATRAHSQHVQEDSDKQARSFAAANQRATNTATRSDIRKHDDDYVKPAESVEKSYQMMNSAFNEYEAARKAGKELPTGAQSMLALSTHLSTTFGNVKGARVTKDMIHEHLGARSISDDMLTAVQKFTNGDQLSPAQWKAFHDLISESRKLTWETAVKQAKRKDIPVDFLPDDLGGAQGNGGSSAPPAGAKVRDYSHL